MKTVDLLAKISQLEKISKGTRADIYLQNSLDHLKDLRKEKEIKTLDFKKLRRLDNAIRELMEAMRILDVTPFKRPFDVIS
jgi:hypothetical protein